MLASARRSGARSAALGLAAAALMVSAAACGAPPPETSTAPEWESLFNGTDLTGWTPKIRYSALGVDSGSVFRVEEGLLTVSYADYGAFGERFGHLFYAEPLSHYRLLVEYRFVGEQARGGPEWAFKNSGVMFHSQPPESMLQDQDFPISLEAQLLGGNGTDPRPTANLCTPGTHVEIDGTLVEQHCVPSTSRTIHDERWVTFELYVRGDSIVHHIVDGDTVLTYGRPVIGGGVVNGHDPAAKPDGAPLASGYVALQSESHPIQFRRIMLQRLDARPSG